MIKEEAIKWLTDMPVTTEEREAVSMAIDALNDVQYGEWERKDGHYGCTLCGHQEDEPLDSCPNCQAKMTLVSR